MSLSSLCWPGPAFLATSFSFCRVPPSRARELPGLNHLFQTAGTGLVAEYGQIEQTLAPAVLQQVGDWILSTAPPR